MEAVQTAVVARHKAAAPTSRRYLAWTAVLGTVLCWCSGQKACTSPPPPPTLSFTLVCNTCPLLENSLGFHPSATGSDVALLLCYS